MRALGWGLDSLPRIARGEGSHLSKADKNVAVLSEGVGVGVGASDIVDDEGWGPQAVDCGISYQLVCPRSVDGVRRRASLQR
jgi:hypothetical protein